ncbi:hypothetical protein [Actinocrispum wychmicini]|uniref:hypothetical protein n=1 Tax=Actinocrispum wychmicini TaxID=1213861 RepID=UPI0010435831|nr:hypothetical protein [Actinocrispum wychmicini]
MLFVRLVFSRSLNPSIDAERATVAIVQDVLLSAATRWSEKIVAWEPNLKARAAVDFDRAGALAEMVAVRTRTTFGFNSGRVELRGATREFVVVVSVNDRPTRPVGGHLQMANEVTVQILTPSVAGVSSLTFAGKVFEELCVGCVPLWGAVHLDSEYRAKVMQTTPSLRAIGRDFGRFLPGLFAVNYFSDKYVELFSSSEVLALPGARRVEHGVFLDVADPFAWEVESERYSAALARIGKELFFDRLAPDRATVAPTFADCRE